MWDKDSKPTREIVIQVLNLLISHDASREKVSDWAEGWFFNDDYYPEASLGDALHSLIAADAISVDRPFLFEEVDFKEWLIQAAATED